MVGIAIFSSDPVLRRNLEQLPRDDPAVVIVGMVDQASSLRELDNRDGVDVLMADVPTQELLAEYRAGRDPIPLVVLLEGADGEDAVRALNAGARAVLNRSASGNEIIAAVKFAFEIAESTVSKYMIRRRGPPSQTWRTFLRNHADAIASIDLCVVPTLTFECLFAFPVLGHGRRQLLWFAVTRHPTAEWLAQQIVEAFPWGTAPTYLVRDNDGAYGQAFTNRVRTMGIRDHPISPRSPWQNPYVSSHQSCPDCIITTGG
jgi:CheY-like chemotaxis protein